MNVQPSTSFEAVADGFATGLTGTIGVRIIDNAGATTTARVTAGIAEYPSGSGIYQKTLTSPATAGQYSIVWDDTSSYATEDLTVTATTLAALTGNLYVTRDEIKTAFSLTDQTYADDDIDMCCTSASRAIDLATYQFFYTNAGIRYYTPEPYAKTIEIDPLVTLTTLEADTAGTGSYTTWTENTDFYLDPVNATEDGKPYERIRLRTQAQTFWPQYERGVKVTGTFGWAEIPSEVRQYAKFLAGKLLYRTRHAPFGIVTVSGDIGAVARLARTDPDFDTLIGHLVKTRPFA
jgi:hypothetical protein